MKQENFTKRKNIGKIYGIKNEPDYESLGLTNNAKCFYSNTRQKIISRIKDVLDSLKYSNALIEELHTDKDQPNSESVIIELFSVLCVISAISLRSGDLHKPCVINGISEFTGHRYNSIMAFFDYPRPEVFKKHIGKIDLRRPTKFDEGTLSNKKLNIRPDFILNDKSIQIKIIDIDDQKQVDNQISRFNKKIIEGEAKGTEYCESFDYVFICTFGCNNENKEKIIQAVKKHKLDKVYLFNMHRYYFGAPSGIFSTHVYTKTEIEKKRDAKNAELDKLFMCCGINRYDDYNNIFEILPNKYTSDRDLSSHWSRNLYTLRSYWCSYEFEMLCRHNFDMWDDFDYDKIKESGVNIEIYECEQNIKVIEITDNNIKYYDHPVMYFKINGKIIKVIIDKDITSPKLISGPEGDMLYMNNKPHDI